jgi:hypothetical protein
MHLIGEAVKQSEFSVPPLPFPIKGKIVKYTSEDGKDQYTLVLVDTNLGKRNWVFRKPICSR